ncbi:olfactory receptor 10A6-like [Siphateles boraxobius]|uniref:olfactory receptor 10A6-like n=1 Tax=Siphateles boraxobius TaxID=180520 RepID=UPI0040629845
MIFSNSVLIYVICVERGLHKPMYIFICNLACINLYGGSAVTPFILTKIITENYQISWLNCLVQIFSIFTYGGCDLTNLTVMAYDRYISICYPLEYEKIITPKKVVICVAVSWLLPFLRSTVTISITGKLIMCGVIIEKVYCDNFSVVKLACSDTLSNNIYGVFMMFLTSLLVVIIFYTYVRIIFICLKLSKGGRVKFSTCIPHLIALLNFVIGSCFELFQSRFNMRHVPYTVRVIVSLMSNQQANMNFEERHGGSVPILQRDWLQGRPVVTWSPAGPYGKSRHKHGSGGEDMLPQHIEKRNPVQAPNTVLAAEDNRATACAAHLRLTWTPDRKPLFLILLQTLPGARYSNK